MTRRAQPKRTRTSLRSAPTQPSAGGSTLSSLPVLSTQCPACTPRRLLPLEPPGPATSQQTRQGPLRARVRTMCNVPLMLRQHLHLHLETLGCSVPYALAAESCSQPPLAPSTSTSTSTFHKRAAREASVPRLRPLAPLASRQTRFFHSASSRAPTTHENLDSKRCSESLEATSASASV